MVLREEAPAALKGGEPQQDGLASEVERPQDLARHPRGAHAAGHAHQHDLGGVRPRVGLQDSLEGLGSGLRVVLGVLHGLLECPVAASQRGCAQNPPPRALRLALQKLARCPAKATAGARTRENDQVSARHQSGGFLELPVNRLVHHRWVSPEPGEDLRLARTRGAHDLDRTGLVDDHRVRGLHFRDYCAFRGARGRRRRRRRGLPALPIPILSRRGHLPAAFPRLGTRVRALLR